MSTDNQNPDDKPLVDVQEQTQPDIYWKPWTVKHIDTVAGEQFHMTPNEDSKSHLLSEVCDCSPEYYGTRMTQGGRELPFFIHKSWDLREIDEWWYYNIQHPDLGKTDNDIFE